MDWSLVFTDPQSNCYSVKRIILSVLLIGSICNQTHGLRIPRMNSEKATINQNPKATAVFAMGSFWRGEAVFGCLPGVRRTRVGYCGGTKVNPDYHSIGDHAESVEIEYDPSTLRYEQLLDIFWANHDPTQTFGQGPDVGDQYRSVIFTQTEAEASLAYLSKEREQVKLGEQIVATEIEPLSTFYPAGTEHQKFALRRKPSLLQLLGDLSDAELVDSPTAAKLNGYAASLCPNSVEKLIDSKVRPLLESKPKLLQLFEDYSSPL